MRIRISPRVALWAVLMLALLLAGCTGGDAVTAPGASSPGASVPGAPAPTAAAATDLPASDPTADAPLRMPGDCAPEQPWPRLVADQLPTAALRCGTVRERVAGQGEWAFRITERSASGLGALLAALRLPDGPVPADQACRRDLPLPVQVTLEIDGRRVTRRTPTDSCGKTRAEVRTAWAAMTWTEIERVRGTQTRPEGAVTAGCEANKDMIRVLDQDVAPGARNEAAAAPAPSVVAGGALRVCRAADPAALVAALG